MKPKAFKLLWQSKFPEAYPIGYELREVYPDRWFRIHSLPKSKRYAETEEEYEILLRRQNEVIDDLIGEDTDVFFLSGVYQDDISNSHHNSINELEEFQKVDTLELHKIRPAENEDQVYLDIYLRQTAWKANRYNNFLKAIADDEFRMMIVCPTKNRIINPYDGGVDLILESEKMRDNYKEKYQEWLSKHPKGL